MAMRIIPNEDTSYLDQMLIDHGRVRAISWRKKLRTIPHHHIQQWCLRHGAYQLPTKELIKWLENQIAGRRALEICAGWSCMGRHLNIPMTDGFMHQSADVRRHYLMMGQAITIPDPEVQQMEAISAVVCYKPQVVIAAWATQKGDGSDGNSVTFGVDEETLLEAVETYIHIGNRDVHDRKRIMDRYHEEFAFPWLVSRGFDQSQNRVWIWDNR
jgi:hypothetical protein